MFKKIAVLSIHTCPLNNIGEKHSGGMNVYIESLYKELSGYQCSIDIFTKSHQSHNTEIIQISPFLRVIHVNGIPENVEKNTSFGYLSDIERSIENFVLNHDIRYSIMHSHYWLSGSVGLSLSKKWKIPHVSTFHTLAQKKIIARVGEYETNERLMVESIMATKSDSIIISTQDEADTIKDIYNIPTNKLNVIPGGVDLSLFRPKDKSESKKQLALTGGEIILAVARLEPLKGLDILLSAIYKIENHSEITLLIAGDYLNNQIEFQRLQTIITALQLTKNVKFLGNIEHTKMPLYMSAADVLVMPSYYESFGLAALEAMACGTPVITSRNSGAKTFIEQGTSGYLIPWNCPEPYAERLETLLKNPILRANMGHQAIIQANKMSWSIAATKTNGVYANLIKSA